MKHSKLFQKRLIHTSHRNPTAESQHAARRGRPGAHSQLHSLVPRHRPDADPEVRGGEEARVLCLQQVPSGSCSADR